MTEVSFKDYGFKPEEIIEGLNKYYRDRANGKPSYVRILDKFTVYHILNYRISEAINWLREEHNIFYTPGMKVEDAIRPEETKDIFDTPRYRFLSILSAELGFRTIVGPGNADKTEDDILRVVKHRDEARKEFLRKLRCDLGVPAPVVKGNMEKMEEDIFERIGMLKEGNWPCENGNTFADYMRKQFPKECEKWKVAPLEGGSVRDWVQYIFGVLDEWRNRALKAEEERDTIYEKLGMNPADDNVSDIVAAIMKLREDRAKYKGMLNTMYGASYGDNMLPCYRDTCNNAKAIKERDAANDALAEIRAKIREVYRGVFSCGMEENYSYTSALNDILEDYKFLKKLKEKAEEKTVDYKTELNELRKSHDNLSDLYNSACKLLGEYLKEAKDILGIDSCDKDTVISAIKALKSAYEKLQKDYDSLGNAYSVVLRWNNTYADARRLLEVPADADAGVMINALNKLKYDCETCDRLRKLWHERYTSEHTRANGEHKRAEKCFGEIAALKTQVASLDRSLKASANEQVGIDAFRNELRKLEAEKSKVIEALGQDIWDDCVE